MRALLLGERNHHLEVGQASQDSLFLHGQDLSKSVGGDQSVRILLGGVNVTESFVLFRGPSFNYLHLRFDNVEAARDELIFKDWYLIVHAKIYISMELEKHFRDAFTNLLVQTVDGDSPEAINAFKLIRCDAHLDIEHLRVDRGCLDHFAAGRSCSGSCDLVLIGIKAVGLHGATGLIID